MSGSRRTRPSTLRYGICERAAKGAGRLCSFTGTTRQSPFELCLEAAAIGRVRQVPRLGRACVYPEPYRLVRWYLLRAARMETFYPPPAPNHVAGWREVALREPCGRQTLVVCWMLR